MKILVADDAEIQRTILRRKLEALGHEVATSRDGDEAWRLFQGGRFPLVVSDWMMPGLDGPELCRRIRRVEDNFYTYVILLTGREGDADRLEGLEAGADDFITKPVNVQELTVRLAIASRILAVHERLSEQNDRLAELATTDGLTGVKNRREFQRSLDVAAAAAARQGSPLSVVLLDVDHFKSYNDTFGHPRGDDVLRRIGSLLREGCRGHETAARYGGEEFALILPGADATQARDAAERIRRAVAVAGWEDRPITASFGVATREAGCASAADLVAAADRALYRAKALGRDRVSHAEYGMDEGDGPVGLEGSPRQKVGCRDILVS